MSFDITPDPPPWCVNAFVAITLRYPAFNPENPAYEDAIDWLIQEGYVRQTANGPITTPFGLAFFTIVLRRDYLPATET